MIEVYCKECINLSDDGCIPFGNDANIAVKKCAEDGFRNYVTKSELHRCEMNSQIDDLQRKLKEYLDSPTTSRSISLTSVEATLCCLGIELLKEIESEK